MSNALTTLTRTLATKLDMGDGADLIGTLKATAFKGQVSDAQMTALLVVANQYALNPWTKEIYAFPDKNNGIVPVVGVDGWSRIINSHPQFDGIEFEQDAESCTCIIYRKDRNRPTKVTECMEECKRGTGPWVSHPRRMLRHKAMIQCARLAFGYGGIYDQDEAERIVEASPVKHMGAADVVQQPAAGRPALPASYPEEAFADNLPKWRAAIQAGKATAEQIVARASTKGQLTDEQQAAIRAPIEAAPAQQQPDADGVIEQPAMTYAQVADRLYKAGNMDQLADAGSLISLAPADHRHELTEIYNQRAAQLEA